MIPLRDNIRARNVPLINYLLLSINIAVFFNELGMGEALESFVYRYGLVPWEMTSGVATSGFSSMRHITPWITSMFIHGGWMHIIGNMWFLHIFGDNVEDRLGRSRFLVLYLSGGLLAGLAQVLSAPGSQVPMVGASGAISAVVGAYLVLYPRARILTLIPIFILFYFAQLPAFIFIGLWFLMQLLYGSAALADTTLQGGVAWWAHIGGFGAGMALALVLKSGTHVPRLIDFKKRKVNVATGSWRRP
jgi:membrane associated rhomboid family serine protease